MKNLQPVFSVPFATLEMENSESLNRELRDFFLATEKRGREVANPDPFVNRNEALFESRFDLFDWPEPCVQRLNKFCLSAVYGLIGELNGYDQQRLASLHYKCESWFHITRRGGYFGPHVHALHAWSGVYCVQHDGDDPESQSGRLVFHHPNPAAVMYTDLSTHKLKPPFSTGPLRIRLQPGQLVLFPSWLEHQVYPYEGNGLRITVAFNLRFAQVS